MSFTECAMEQNIQVQSHRGNEHYSLDPYVQVRCKCVQRARIALLVWRMLVSSRVGQHILCMHGGSVDAVREISYSDGCQEMGPLRTYS